MDQRFVIVGGGDFGKEVFLYVTDLRESQSTAIGGVLDDARTNLDWGPDSPQVLGTIDGYAIQPNDRFLIAIGDPGVRRDVAARLAKRGGALGTIIHPTAYVAPTARLGAGCILAPFTFVGPQAALEPNTVLNVYASAGHDAVIGQHCVLSPYAVLNGRVVLEEGVFMGTHATVIVGKRVGKNAKIAAGAVVFRDVPPLHLAVGNPAKSRGLYRDSD